MPKALVCPVCGGRSTANRPRFKLSDDGIMRRASVDRCWYAGGFSGRKDEQSQGFYCKTKNGGQ